jgi:hypothetical protein
MLHEAVCNKSLLVSPAGKRAARSINGVMHSVTKQH